MPKFKIGDRVRVTFVDAYDASCGVCVGDFATVLQDCDIPFVRMDKYGVALNDASGLCEDGHGKAMIDRHLELVVSTQNDDIRDQLAKGYEAIENAKACFDKAKEMLDAKDAKPPRNWPERIEAGDCFEQANGSRYLVCGTKFVNLDTGALWLLGGGPSGNDKTDLSYLGKIDLTIRTDAHEPTGAELVGWVCEFADLMSGPWSPGECAAFGQNPAYPYRKAGGAEWKFARLAK